MSLLDEINRDILINLFEIVKGHPEGGTLIEVRDVNHDWEHYQREMIEPLVKKHRELFVKDPNHPWCGILAKREDGSYWSINGQHHTEAAMREGVKKLRYLVIPSSGWEYEKKIFDLYQEWQRPTK